MSVYQRDPEMAPDADFEPGDLVHLVPGNRGRLLDPRRTPVLLTTVREATGMFTVRIEAFEDRGAEWEIPFERVGIFQFERPASRASSTVVQGFERIRQKFNQPLVIGCDETTTKETRSWLAQAREDARAWFEAESSFFRARRPTLPDPAQRRGDERLFNDLHAYCKAWDVDAIEGAFATRFVSNPSSGELVKGHRIVMAELGLVPFTGTIVRDPTLFEGGWSKRDRGEHIVRRLAFVSTLFELLGHADVCLYRGMSSREPLHTPANRTFVSATFSEDVARSHFEIDDEAQVSVLYRQRVPVDRIFMTYVETEAMNRMFLEAEAVLLVDPDTRSF